jgi:hypothetical protein
MKFHSNYATGLVNNLQESVYRADPALSTSDLKTFKKSAFKFAMEKKGVTSRGDTPSMRLGRLYHQYALERDRWDEEVMCCPDEFADKRKKASKEWWANHARPGLTVIKETELQAVTGMHDQLCKLALYHGGPTVGKVLETAATEVSVFAKNLRKGIDLKCRIDILHNDNGKRSVLDIKTTREGGASPREYKYTSKRLNYHWQEANYKQICEKAGFPIENWYWIVVETEAPYETGIYTYKPHDLLMANHELEETYIKLEGCLSTGVWPSHTPSEPMQLSLYDSA